MKEENIFDDPVLFLSDIVPELAEPDPFKENSSP